MKIFRPMFITFASVLWMLALPSTSLAQGELTEAIFTKVVIPHIEKEVGITREQMEKLKIVLQDVVASNGMTITIRLTSEEEAIAIDKKVEKILTESQKKRYYEIFLQFGGLFELSRPTFASMISLSELQAKAVKEAANSYKKELSDAITAGEFNADPEGADQRIKDMKTKQEKKIEALLTDAQKKKWKEMLGKELKRPQAPPPPYSPTIS